MRIRVVRGRVMRGLPVLVLIFRLKCLAMSYAEAVLRNSLRIASRQSWKSKKGVRLTMIYEINQTFFRHLFGLLTLTGRFC